MNLDNNKKELKVSLFYVTPPVDSQLDKIKDFVAAKEGVNKDEVKIDLVEKKDLVPNCKRQTLKAKKQYRELHA